MRGRGESSPQPGQCGLDSDGIEEAEQLSFGFFCAGIQPGKLRALSFAKLSNTAWRPLDRSGDRWEGASTARPLQACERLTSGFLQRHGLLPRHARTLKNAWCAWQWRPPLPSALPRGRSVASKGAAWWCFWRQILRSDRQARPPALSILPYRPRVIRHVRLLTEGVGEWRLATLQHTLSREPETLLSVSVLDAIEKCVSARDVPFEGDLDAGPERPLGVAGPVFPHPLRH